MQGVQLPLGVQLRPDARFDQFLAGDNSLLIEQLRQFSQLESPEQSIYLFGPKGSGCSYLLNACCHEAEAAGLQTIYLPMTLDDSLEPDLFCGLEQFDLVCIDQIDQIAGDLRWEEAIFHLYNRMRDIGRRILFAATEPPANLGLGLPDLESRLNWGLVLRVRPLDDQQKLVALSAQARALGLTVSNDVLLYLMTHGERNLGALFEYLNQLDRASLVSQRRITIPFVKQVLGWGG